MNDIITIAKSVPTFKSKALNTATKTIFDAVNAYNTTATETRKTVSVVLARLEKNKAYKEDGFNSLAEYAERIGLEKSLTHKLENAGRLLDSDNATIKDFASKADYSKLAILASANETDVESAIKSGELTPASTQAEVKAWKADNTAKNAPAKVLPNYTVDIVHGDGSTVHYDSIAIDAIEELDGYRKVGSFKKQDMVPGSPDVVNDVSWDVYANEFTGALLRLHAVKVKATPKAKKPATVDVRNMSDEMLKALMEEYARRQAEK